MSTAGLRAAGGVALILIASLVVSTGPTEASPPGVQAAGGVTVTSLALSSTSVSVRGENVVAVAITVHLSDPDGVEAIERLCDAGRCLSLPAVTLARVDGAELSPLQAQRDQSLPGAASMRLVAGTPTDGTYEGTVYITSAQAGDLAVGCVLTPRHPFDDVTPASACSSGAALPSHPVLHVRATNRPLITVVTSPSRATGSTSTFVARVRAIESSTHLPLAGRRLMVCTLAGPTCFDTAESLPPAVPTAVLTDADGYANVRLPFGASPQDAVALLAPGPRVATHPEHGSGVPAYLTVALAPVDPQIQLTLTAATSRGSVAAGSAVVLSGSAGPCRPRLRGCIAVGRTVTVERWIHRRWSAIGRANVRASGRWSYSLIPSGPGVHSYRGQIASAQCDAAGRCLLLATTSPAVLVRSR